MSRVDSKVVTEVPAEVVGPSRYSEMKTTLERASLAMDEKKKAGAASEFSVEPQKDSNTDNNTMDPRPTHPPHPSQAKSENRTTLPSMAEVLSQPVTSSGNSNSKDVTTPHSALTALAPKATPLAPDHTSHTPLTKSQPTLVDMSQVSRDPSLPLEIHTNIPIMKSSSPSSKSSPSNHTTPVKSSSGKNGNTLRRGKWTVEEEAYVARVIEDFNSGFLNASAGTTLRSYLSEKLQCDPMRITKKFTGEACIGKRVFHPAVRSAANAAAIDKAQAELDALERRWRRRLEMQQRESAKKAAASAAAANAAGGRMIQGVPVAILSRNPLPDASSQLIGQNVVTQAASWLDRANAILRGSKVEAYASSTSGSRDSRDSPESLPSSELENQMQEVQRLIYEGPIIQQTTAGLPNLLSNQTTTNTNATSNDAGPPTPPEPADKRMKLGNSLSGAEDAEALVGFLRSVRASAAAGNGA